MNGSGKHDVALQRRRKRSGQRHAFDRQDFADVEDPEFDLAFRHKFNASGDRLHQRELRFDCVGDAELRHHARERRPGLPASRRIGDDDRTRAQERRAYTICGRNVGKRRPLTNDEAHPDPRQVDPAGGTQHAGLCQGVDDGGGQDHDIGHLPD